VVSTLALLDFEEETKRMRLLSTHPGVTVEQVIENTGFDLIVPDDPAQVGKNEPPTAEELRILREEIDPEGFYI
jgi:glutaconate CoA-transferase subunit B